MNKIQISLKTNFMKIYIIGWNDGSNDIRSQIIKDVMGIMRTFFKNDGLYENNLEICNIVSTKCQYADDRPCTHFDRSRICINSSDGHWCQFVHQLSHELCHCSTSRVQLPQQIQWFDEFICCCSSFLVEKFISTSKDDKYNYMYSRDTAKTFHDYLEIEEVDHLYSTDSTQKLFSSFRKLYEKDPNLIKNHDVYIREFFQRTDSNWDGLSFVGKMWKVNINNILTVEDFLSRLLLRCNSAERNALNVVIELFGLKVNV